MHASVLCHVKVILTSELSVREVITRVSVDMSKRPSRDLVLNSIIIGKIALSLDNFVSW